MTRYRVTSSTPFAGYPPGAVFDADLDPELEQRASERGSITITEQAEEGSDDAEADRAH